MAKYVALLRGIGPGNPNMRNEKLRRVCEQLGFTNVRTVISSGNVLFESPIKSMTKLEAMLEAAWPAQLDFQSTTIIRSARQLQQLISKEPFGKRIHSPRTSLNITFIKQQPAKAVEPPDGEGYKIVAMFDREACSVIDTTRAKTPDLMTQLEKQFGKEITTRTWKTIERIVQNQTD